MAPCRELEQSMNSSHADSTNFKKANKLLKMKKIYIADRDALPLHTTLVPTVRQCMDGYCLCHDCSNKTSAVC